MPRSGQRKEPRRLVSLNLDMEIYNKIKTNGVNLTFFINEACREYLKEAKDNARVISESYTEDSSFLLGNQIFHPQADLLEKTRIMYKGRNYCWDEKLAGRMLTHAEVELFTKALLLLRSYANMATKIQRLLIEQREKNKPYVEAVKKAKKIIERLKEKLKHKEMKESV